MAAFLERTYTRSGQPHNGFPSQSRCSKPPRGGDEVVILLRFDADVDRSIARVGHLRPMALEILEMGEAGTRNAGAL